MLKEYDLKQKGWDELLKDLKEREDEVSRDITSAVTNILNDVRKNGVKGLLYGSDVKNWKEVEDYIRKEFLCQE